MFFGARSLTMASKPFQKTSLATPLAGRTLLFDEAVELGRDLESVGGGAGGHGVSP